MIKKELRKPLIMFVGWLIALLLSILILTLPVNAARTDDYQTTGNIFSYNSPYPITYTFNYGANADMYRIAVTGDFANVEFITFKGLSDVLLLDGIGYTSGSGLYAHISGDSGILNMYTVYDRWYDLMVFDVRNITFTTTIYITFHYTLTGGITTTQFNNNFRDVVSISLSTFTDWATVIQNAREEGFREGVAYAEEQSYIEAFLQGKSEGLAEASLYYYHETDTYYTFTEWGAFMYNQGLSESGFNWFQIFVYVFTLPFQLFNIELMPGLYIGYFAVIPLVLGVLSLFLTLRGKKK